jgi:hypothetical protein
MKNGGKEVEVKVKVKVKRSDGGIKGSRSRVANIENLRSRPLKPAIFILKILLCRVEVPRHSTGKK